jgi:hypothetical protein
VGEVVRIDIELNTVHRKDELTAGEYEEVLESCCHIEECTRNVSEDFIDEETDR